jgi:ADP-ribose pyrophosphatase
MTNSDPGIRILPWRVRKSALVLDEGRWARVRRDECELPSGDIIPDYFYWEGNDFAQVFALTQKAEVVLTRQYKHGVKEIVVELPAGQIGEGEDPRAAAEREMREETGFVGSDWVRLGQMNVSSAKSSTRATAFLLRDAEKRYAPKLDFTEQIEVLLYPLNEVLNLISRGAIRDVNSVATTLLALRELGHV